jgi:hypothetical protein
MSAARALARPLAASKKHAGRSICRIGHPGGRILPPAGALKMAGKTWQPSRRRGLTSPARYCGARRRRPSSPEPYCHLAAFVERPLNHWPPSSFIIKIVVQSTKAAKFLSLAAFVAAFAYCSWQRPHPRCGKPGLGGIHFERLTGTSEGAFCYANILGISLNILCRSWPIGERLA